MAGAPAGALQPNMAASITNVNVNVEGATNAQVAFNVPTQPEVIGQGPIPLGLPVTPGVDAEQVGLVFQSLEAII